MFEPRLNSTLASSLFVHIALPIVTLLAFIIYFTKKDSRILTHLKRFNGPTAIPIFGNALSLIGAHEDLVRVMLNWVEKHGSNFKIWIGNAPYVFIGEPKHVEKILTSSMYVNKGTEYELLLEAWLGTGLLTARREKWFHRRKLLTPTFHFKILEDFIPIFNEQAKLLNAVLELQRQQSDSFDICPFISKCTLDIICETAMGKQINAQIGGEADYVQKVCRLSDIVMIRGLNPLYRISFIWKLASLGRLEKAYLKDLHDFTDQVIKDRKMQRKRSKLHKMANSLSATTDRETPDDGTKVRKAFLDLLLDVQEENNMSDADIREEVDTFMFEGHDTTAANLDWTILLLACYPAYQKLVHDELNEIFGDDADRSISGADLTKLKYLECFVKESLRLYPSVPFFLRKVEQDIPLDEEKLIPKGTTLAVAPYIVHRNPDIFPDPEKFDPDRFSQENSVGRHAFAYIPFSAGARNCIGQKFALMEEKIILATILRKYRIEQIDTRDTVAQLPDVILRPKGGIKIKLVKRN